MSLDNMQGKLSRHEMKNVMAGYVEDKSKGSMICGCTGSGKTMDAVSCNFNTFDGAYNCAVGATSYCQSHYGGTTSCSISYNSQN